MTKGLRKVLSILSATTFATSAVRWASSLNLFQYDDKLVSSYAGDDVAWSQTRGETKRDLLKQSVACFVSHRFVEDIEVIHVDI